MKFKISAPTKKKAIDLLKAKNKSGTGYVYKLSSLRLSKKKTTGGGKTYTVSSKYVASKNKYPYM